MITFIFLVGILITVGLMPYKAEDDILNQFCNVKDRDVLLQLTSEVSKR